METISPFPDLPTSQPTDAIWAIALHALHVARVPGIGDVDRDWLDNLPPSGMTLAQQEGHYFEIDPARIYKDTYMQFPTVWGLVATVDAYANGRVLGRVRGLQWVESAIRDRNLSNADASSVNWWRAELLQSLELLKHRAAPAPHYH